MSELLKMFEFKQDLKPATKKSYECVYNRMIESNQFVFDIAETTQDKIIKYINEIDAKPSSRLNMLNVAIVLKQAHNKPVVDLLKQREKYKLEQQLIREQSNKELTTDLPTIAELKDYLQSLFNEGKWLGFVVNFLLINLSVRNADLFLDIVDSGKNLPADNNYLVIRSKDIHYIRNVYKTADTYNTKKNIITDKRFITAVKQLGLRPLIVNKEGEKVPLTSIGTYVKRLSYNELGEILLFKAVLNNASVNGLKKSSKARGTDISTAVNYYHTGGVGIEEV
jgi:hypothetical protein